MTKTLETLIDGKWHTLREIKQKTKLNKYQIERVMEFLERYGFISVDRIAKKIILNKNAKRFLVQNSTS